MMILCTSSLLSSSLGLVVKPCSLRKNSKLLHCLNYRLDILDETFMAIIRNKYALNSLGLPIRLQKDSHLSLKIKLFNKLPDEAFWVDRKYFKLAVSKWLNTKAISSVRPSDYIACDICPLNF